MDWKLGGLVFTVLLAALPQARADGFFQDGALLRAKMDSDELEAMFYVLGVLDSVEAYSFLFPRQGRQACVPAGVKAGQALAVVKKFLDENPEKWHEPAPYLVHNAARDAWPCPTETPPK